MVIVSSLLALFAIAFIAATFLPMQSEAALVALILSGITAPWILILVASLGNIFGSVVNWFIGLKLNEYQDKKWFPATEEQLSRARRRYNKYGKWSLLLSWVPIIGDPLTIAAGLMRERLSVFIALVSVAKTARYTFLGMVTLA